jgi:hypothetical protein
MVAWRNAVAPVMVISVVWAEADAAIPARIPPARSVFIFMVVGF